jgi:MSHA biogenesis protein MshM
LQSGKGLIKITGEVGTGKTLLCQKLLAALAGDFQATYLPYPLLKPFELYQALAEGSFRVLSKSSENGESV